MTHPVEPKVVLGLQGTQMPANALRGIGRLSSGFCRAFIERFPQNVAALSIDPYLPAPSFINTLPKPIPVVTSDQRPDCESPLIFHALSVMEDLSLERIWPRWAQDSSVGLVVTMYDMIPALFPEDHFQGTLRHRLKARYEMVKSADAIIAISKITAENVSEILDISEKSIRVCYGPSQLATSLVNSTSQVDNISDKLGIKGKFVLSIGNTEPRKNLKLLIDAFAQIDSEVRRDWDLVITCSQSENGQIDQINSWAKASGVDNRVIVLGYIEDSTLISLYQTTSLLVYPSLFEGLGLPILEAFACGVPVLVSDIPSFRELVTDPQDCFDPHNALDLSTKLAQRFSDSNYLSQRSAISSELWGNYDIDALTATAFETYSAAAR